MSQGAGGDYRADARTRVGLLFFIACPAWLQRSEVGYNENNE